MIEYMIGFITICAIVLSALRRWVKISSTSTIDKPLTMTDQSYDTSKRM